MFVARSAANPRGTGYLSEPATFPNCSAERAPQTGYLAHNWGYYCGMRADQQHVCPWREQLGL